MGFFLKLILLLILGVPLVSAGAVYLAVDRAPAIDRAAEITPANVERARRIVEQNDPRKLKSGARRTVTINQGDLDLAANYLAHRFGQGSARVKLHPRAAEIEASLRLPLIPLGLYLNFNVKLAEAVRLVRFESLRVGQLAVPAWLAHWTIPRILALLPRGRTVGDLSDAIKRVAISQAQLAITYEWHAELPDKLRAILLSIEERERLRAYQERLAEISRAVSGKRISLGELLSLLLRLAGERTAASSPAEENRTAIFILTLYTNGKSLEMILPEANKWPQPAPHAVLLSQREDFAKHFIVSAALAASAGSPLADAVGLYKELEDSRVGGGFSFTDIAADRAGTRFGEFAVDGAGARKLQQKLAAGASEKDFMPATSDLPESLPQGEFQRRFGGTGGTEFNRMMAEINRRVAALAVYR